MPDINTPTTTPPIRAGLHIAVSKVDLASWRWPHFQARELSCDCMRHCHGEYYHSPAFLDALEAMRVLVGPLKINSARRCKGHNTAVGGARASMHMRTIAADISLTGHNRKSVGGSGPESWFSRYRLWAHIPARGSGCPSRLDIFRCHACVGAGVGI